MLSSTDRATSFDRERPRLVRIAYRMLGSLAEAEDVVQDAWLRWSGAKSAEIKNPPAYLARTVTRLCLDYLKSAKVRRETYVGSWLPEPLIEFAGPSEGADEIEDVTLTLMMALESLRPWSARRFFCTTYSICRSTTWRGPSTAIPQPAVSLPPGRVPTFVHSDRVIRSPANRAPRLRAHSLLPRPAAT